jgi:hypothetical protein
LGIQQRVGGSRVPDAAAVPRALGVELDQRAWQSGQLNPEESPTPFASCGPWVANRASIRSNADGAGTSEVSTAIPAVPSSNAIPWRALTAGNCPLRARIAGNALVPPVGRCSTTTTGQVRRQTADKAPQRPDTTGGGAHHDEVSRFQCHPPRPLVFATGYTDGVVLPRIVLLRRAGEQAELPHGGPPARHG